MCACMDNEERTVNFDLERGREIERWDSYSKLWKSSQINFPLEFWPILLRFSVIFAYTSFVHVIAYFWMLFFLLEQQKSPITSSTAKTTNKHISSGWNGPQSQNFDTGPSIRNIRTMNPSHTHIDNFMYGKCIQIASEREREKIPTRFSMLCAIYAFGCCCCCCWSAAFRID